MATVARLLDGTHGEPHFDDELWVHTVFAFVVSAGKGRMAVDQLADMFVPLYAWRAASFMARSVGESPTDTQGRLDTLCDIFERLRPALVGAWASET